LRVKQKSKNHGLYVDEKNAKKNGTHNANFIAHWRRIG